MTTLLSTTSDKPAIDSKKTIDTNVTKCVEKIIHDFTDEYEIPVDCIESLRGLLIWHTNDLYNSKSSSLSVKSKVIKKKQVDENTIVSLDTEPVSEVSSDTKKTKTVKKKENDTKSEKKKKKPNAYTMFVKKQMNLDDVKNIPHQQRMSFIADRWKTVDPDVKKECEKEAEESYEKSLTESV
jgi:hypothetical protein